MKNINLSDRLGSTLCKTETFRRMELMNVLRRSWFSSSCSTLLTGRMMRGALNKDSELAAISNKPFCKLTYSVGTSMCKGEKWLTFTKDAVSIFQVSFLNAESLREV